LKPKIKNDEPNPAFNLKTSPLKALICKVKILGQQIFGNPSPHVVTNYSRRGRKIAIAPTRRILIIPIGRKG